MDGCPQKMVASASRERDANTGALGCLDLATRGTWTNSEISFGVTKIHVP